MPDAEPLHNVTTPFPHLSTLNTNTATAMKRGAEDTAAAAAAAADQMESPPDAKRVKREQQHDAQEAAGDGDAAAAAVAAVAVKQEPGEEDAERQQPAAGGGAKQEQQQQQQQQDNNESEEEDDAPIQLPVSTTRSSVRKGHECPYLDTILRQNLDFDFEKCCSVSLSPINVYVCLVCGKYFQGRGLSTHAYTHSLETAHHMFMKLDNGKVYCLPDNYEVVDRSLDDIRAVLNPAFTQEQVVRLDADVTWVRALDGSEYMPGLVGLNNMKANDYANVVVQTLARVAPIRDYFLVPANYKGVDSVLVTRFGELIRKLWNGRNFKGQVSPHEFMQAVMTTSQRRFTIEQQSDPVDFWSWLLNALHLALTGGKPKRNSIITTTFQGELEVTTLAGTGKGKAATSTEDVVERVPFLLLGMELPPTPLFKDALEKNIIPQVPIFQCLAKFDNAQVSDDIRAGRRRFRITRLPNFLALQFKRFTKNNFFIEKNPTLVTFPVKNLDLREALPVPTGPDGQPVTSRYDLIANVVHEGKAGQQTSGAPYRVHIHRAVEKAWYEVQDLVVIDVLPQMVALSESYFQVYECQQKHTTPPTSAKAAAGAKGGGGGGSKGKAPPKQQQQQKAAGAGKSGS